MNKAIYMYHGQTNMNNITVKNNVLITILFFPRPKPYLSSIKNTNESGVRQMQTADLQIRAWVSQTRTSVSQISASYRYRYRYIGI